MTDATRITLGAFVIALAAVTLWIIWPPAVAAVFLLLAVLRFALGGIQMPTHSPTGGTQDGD